MSGSPRFYEAPYEAAKALTPPDEDLLFSDDRADQSTAALETAVFHSAGELIGQVDELLRAEEHLRSDIRDIFQTAHAKGSVMQSWTAIVCERNLPEAFRDRGREIGTAITEVVATKGFIWSGAVATVEEHDRMGSTVAGMYRDRAVNVPIIWLRGILEAEGTYDGNPAEKLYSLEEIDRARRLQGSTSIDLTTGEVTGEIDIEASQDPYYFLDPDQKEAIIAQEAELEERVVQLYADAIATTKASLRIIPVLCAYGMGQVTGRELRDHVERYIYQPGIEASVGADVKTLKRLGIEAGVFDRYLTPQEILTRTDAELPERYLQNPYTPLGIQDGVVSVEEAAQRRSEEVWFGQSSAVLGFERPSFFTLEELDEQGVTMRSPRILDESPKEGFIDAETEEFVGYFKDKIKFPFARPEDWFFKD